MKSPLLLFILLFISFHANTYSIESKQTDRTKGNSDTTATYRDEVKEILRIYDQKGITKNHSYLYLSLGTSLFQVNKLDSAIYYLHKGLKPYQKNPEISDDQIRKLLYLFLTHAYNFTGQHDSAIVYGHRLVDQVVALKDSASIAEYSYTLAIVYDRMNNTTEAVKYYKLGGSLATKIGKYSLAFTCYNAAAVSCSVNGRLPEALSLVKQAMRYAEKTGSLSDKGRGWSSMASIYYDLKKYDKAKEHYEKALECYTAAKDTLSYNLTKTAYTDALAKAGQQQAAFKSMVDSTASDELELSALTRDYEGSVEDLTLRLRTSTVNAETKKMKYGILHQQYLEREAITLRQRIWLISLLSGAVIIVLLLLYNRQRQKTKAKAAAHRLEEKENEYLTLQNETEQRLIRNYIDGLESERERISKELHDGICNDLLGLEMELKRILGNRQELEKQMAFLAHTRENIRTVSHSLMPPIFQYATIDEMLADYTMHLSLPESMTVEYTQTESVDWDSISKEVAFEVYRIAQEAINNSIKHSHATKVEVSLVHKENRLTITIWDNGTGFDKNRRQKGIGIHTITERAKSVGGSLHIETGDGGTMIKAQFVI